MKERKALIVEDDPDMTQLVRLALADNGYGSVLANNLKGAIAQLQHIELDVMVLDVGLPDGNGLSLITQVRKIATVRPMLIVVISACNTIGDMERALELGADEYLFKPTCFDKLSQVLGQGLKRTRLCCPVVSRPSKTPLRDVLRSLWP